jgi:phage I-like protein
MSAVASYVIVLAEGKARMPIAQLGVRYKGKQKIEITRPMLAEVVANFRKRDTGEVPIDYDHAIEFAAGDGQPVPAAGWLKSIEDGPDGAGILWGSVQWTARAAGMIKAGEYKYISPVIDPTVRDNKTGDVQGWTLTSAALTNSPILQGMPALVLSEGGWQEDRPGGLSHEEKKKTVKVTKLVLMDRAAASVRATLDDGTEVTVNLEGLEAPPKVLRLSDVKRNATSQEYDFAGLECGDGVLIAGEVFRAQQAQMALSEAVKAGKILPAQRAMYEKMALGDLVGFRALVETMKPQVDLGTRGTGATEGGDPALGVQSQVHLQIDPLVRAKIAASAGKLDYGEAWKLVLRERPELEKAYMATVGKDGR